MDLWFPLISLFSGLFLQLALARPGAARELVWLLEHAPLYTAGTSARPEDLLDPQLLPVHRTGRGGRYTYHGVALNVDPELEHYRGIVPCGIAEHGVTSLRALRVGATIAEIDAALRATFREVFEVTGGCETPC